MNRFINIVCLQRSSVMTHEKFPMDPAAEKVKREAVFSPFLLERSYFDRRI